MSANPDLWTLKEVLRAVPVGRSTWYAGVKSGKFPQPVRITLRKAFWRSKDIIKLLKDAGAL